MKKENSPELLALRTHPILPITLEVYEDPDNRFEYLVCGKISGLEHTGLTGVIAGDSEGAIFSAALVGLTLESIAPNVWGVIPDTFSWSARLKRAMTYLVSLAPDWDTLDAWGYTKYSFPGLKDFRKNSLEVPTLEDLAWDAEILPDEELVYSEKQVLYIRAYHAIRAVIGFDWSTATEATLRQHPGWLEMEPSAEYEAPDLWAQDNPHLSVMGAACKEAFEDIDPLWGTREDGEEESFFVRLYEPVVTEWKTEFKVPASSQEEANRMVADLKRSKKPFPPEWILNQYLVEGTEPIPDIHGNEYWEVSDQDGEQEDLNITPDLSGQKAFVFSRFMGALPSDGSERYMGPIKFKPIGNDCSTNHVLGVLIAEPIPKSEAQDSMVSVQDIGRILVGNKFCDESGQDWRIVFVFRNPQ